MNPITPRFRLPDEWTGRGRCPVCQVHGRLTVVHQAIIPDHLRCGACASAFEVEAGGSNIRLIKLPPSLGPAHPALLGVWLLPADLPAIVEAALAPAAAAPAPEPSLPDEPAPAPDLSPELTVEMPAPPAAESEPATTTPAASHLPSEPANGAAAAGPEPAPPSSASEPARRVGTRPLRRPDSPVEPAPAAPAPVKRKVTWPLRNPDAPRDQASATPVPAEPPRPLAAEAEAAGPEQSDGAESADLFAELEAVAPRASGDVDAVAQLLLGLVPAEAESAASEPAPAVAGAFTAPPPKPVTAALEPEPPPSPPANAAFTAPPSDLAPAEREPAPTAAGAFTASPPAGPNAPADLPPSIQALLYGEPEIDEPANPAAAEMRAEEPAAPGLAAAQAEVEPPPAAPASGATTAPSTRADDLAARALQLYELGNPLPLIRATLERTGASAAEVTAAVASIQAEEDHRRQRHRRAFIMVGGGGFLLVALIILGGWIISSAGALTPVDPAALTAAVSGPTVTPGGPTLTPTRRYSVIIDIINRIVPGDIEFANGSTPTPGPTSELYGVLFPPTATLEPAAVQATADARATQGLPPDGLPDWARDLVPDGLTVLNVPTPSVSNEGPPAASCPETPGEAVELFGGALEDWTIDRENNGWVLIVVGSPVTLRLPANMSAGYMVFADTLEMRSAFGPATISNVNFAAVACGL